MTNTKAARPIRPTPEELRVLPTLAVMTPEHGTDALRECTRQLGIDVRLELKLETPDEKYWLCTAGAAGPDPEMVQNWIVGNVTIELADGETITYGPGSIADLQKLDYVKIVMRDIDRFADAYEKDPTDETRRQLEAARAEFRQLAPP